MLNSFLAINEDKLSGIFEKSQYSFICAKAHTQNDVNQRHGHRCLPGKLAIRHPEVHFGGDEIAILKELCLFAPGPCRHRSGRQEAQTRSCHSLIIGCQISSESFSPDSDSITLNMYSSSPMLLDSMTCLKA